MKINFEAFAFIAYDSSMENKNVIVTDLVLEQVTKTTAANYVWLKKSKYIQVLLVTEQYYAQSFYTLYLDFQSSITAFSLQLRK